MRIEGSSSILASREKVWERLLDPQVLARTLPGCEKLERDHNGCYAAEMRVGIAAVKGTFKGRVEILDPVPPERFRMKVDAQGPGGFLRGEGTIALAEDGGGTRISYAGDAQVGGVMASVGQRLLGMAEKQITRQFFEAFAGEFREAAPQPGAQPPQTPQP